MVDLRAPRYAPGSGTGIDYSKLEEAYEHATWGEPEEPNLGISTLPAMARLRASKTGESYEQAYQWLIDNSELVDIEGEGQIRCLSSEASTLLLYP